MQTNFWDSLANGFIFGSYFSRPSFGCCNPFFGFSNYSEPYIPPLNKNLLNSIFSLSSVQTDMRATIPFLPNPVVTATPTINTPFTNGDIYTFSPPNFQMDRSGLYNMNYYNSMQMPFLGLTGMPFYQQYAQLQKEIDEITKKAKEKAKTEKKKKTETTKVKPEEKTEKIDKKQENSKKVSTTVENGKSSEAYFDQMLKFVLAREGGYVNHPNDKGGETNKGITYKTYNSYRTKKGLPLQSVKYITDEELREIYYNDYFVASGANKISDPKLALCVFDWAVHSGPNNENLKNALQQSGGDVRQFIQLRKNFFDRLIAKKPSQEVFRNGWYNRLTELQAYVDSDLPSRIDNLA